MENEELLHVIPLNDLYEHHTSIHCPCNPYKDEEVETIIIHNSFDGREFYEALNG